MATFEIQIIVDGKLWSTVKQVAATAKDAEAALRAHMIKVLRHDCRIECIATGRRWNQFAALGKTHCLRTDASHPPRPLGAPTNRGSLFEQESYGR